MTDNNFSEQDRYIRAQKRVKEMKGFYWHLFWYLAVNIFLTFGTTIGAFFMTGDLDFKNLHFGNFAVWFFWGIGLVAHWLNVFGKNIVFSRDWEERKIKEFMEKDKFE
jgi:hypothetical protein